MGWDAISYVALNVDDFGPYVLFKESYSIMPNIMNYI